MGFGAGERTVPGMSSSAHESAGAVPIAEDQVAIDAPAGAGVMATGQLSAAAVRRLHGAAGNAAVGQLLARTRERTLAREPEAKKAETAADLLKKHGTLYVGPRKYVAMDHAALGRDLAERAVAAKDTALIHEVIDALMTSDRDDVAEVLATTAGTRLSAVDEGLRVRLIREMLDAVVDDDAEAAVTTVWLSWGRGDDLARVITNQPALWKKALGECDALVNAFRADIDAFGSDIMQAARLYLGKNREITQAEGANVGLDLGGGKKTSPEQAEKYLDELRKAAKVVGQIQAVMQQLKLVPVGYAATAELQRALSADATSDAEAYKAITKPPPEKLRKFGTPAMFDPSNRPGYPPTGQDTPEMAAWDEVAGHHQSLAALVAGYSRAYPAIHAAVARGSIGDLANSTDTAKSRAVIEDTLKQTLKAIADSEKMLGNGITHYDLVPIQDQLFSNTLAEPAKASREWQKPLYSALGRDHLDKQKARAFWTDLGLGMASAFALIAAPFTGGLTAAVLIGAGMGIGAGMAAASWDKYLSLRPLENAAIKDELSLIQPGAVDAALLEATIATVFVFLDAKGVGKGMKQAAAVNRAQLLAELHGSIEAQEAAAQARMKLQGQAVKEAGMAAAGAGVAVGAHELEAALAEPTFEVNAGGLALDVSGEDVSPAPAQTVSPMRLARTPQQLKAAEAAMTKIDAAKYLPANWGDRFELSVLATILRGDAKGMEGVTYAFRAQHKSGQGIDIIAVGKGPDGKLKIWQVECKWTLGGGLQKLGERGGERQTSRGWTKANFQEWWKGAGAAERRQLLNAVRAANGGRAVSEARLVKLVADAEVIIAGPVGAGVLGVMRKVWGQMAALARGGRTISYREFRPH